MDDRPEVPMSRATETMWSFLFCYLPGDEAVELEENFHLLAADFRRVWKGAYLAHAEQFGLLVKQFIADAESELVEEGEQSASSTITMGMVMDEADWKQIGSMILVENKLKDESPLAYKAIIRHRRFQQIRRRVKTISEATP